jgi:O-antigen/teichoic acid export membrane protein
VWKRLIVNRKSLQSRILSGSFILLSGSGLASAVNLIYNIAVARLLGPDGYGAADAVYTILILLSSVTLSFQIVSAKIVAQQKTPEGKYAGYRGFHLGAWACGILASLVLLAFEKPIADALRLEDPILIVLIAAGIAFYIPLGARRGYLQGAYGFRRLATNLVLEGVFRLGGSLVLIFLGFGVAGVIAANSISVAAVYFLIRPQAANRMAAPLPFRAGLREFSQAIVFFCGQAVIYNFHIVLVKHLFTPTAAGLYAAVAMVGRVVFSFSQAIVNSMFPLVAGTEEEERKDLKVIATSLFLVLAVGGVFALALSFAPAALWTTFFGPGFLIAGKHGLSYLMALYAITTVVYSLSSVIITYEMSYKIANTSWIQLGFSGVVIAGIWLFHSSLLQVILVQLVLMAALFLFVAIPFFMSAVGGSGARRPDLEFPPVTAVRRTSEDEVISEFLRSDFHNPAFRRYREALHDIVDHPNLKDDGENAKRRALFFVRHRALWNELPAGTEWYELDLNEEDLARIRVFPRAQWRNFAHGQFSFTDVIADIRGGENSIDTRFRQKIEQIRARILTEDQLGSVILIGAGRSDPLTIIDGNHRLVAAMLSSPTRLHRLRFLCGFSPRMAECCWYNTNVTTLLRYGRNVLRQSVRRSRSDLQLLVSSPADAVLEAHEAFQTANSDGMDAEKIAAGSHERGTA